MSNMLRSKISQLLLGLARMASPLWKVGGYQMGTI